MSREVVAKGDVVKADVAPRPRPAHVLVTGAIRSGTTWLGKLLATARGTVYVHEPFNPDSMWNACTLVPRRFVYLTRGSGALFRPLIARVLRLEARAPSPFLHRTVRECQRDVERQLGAPHNRGVERDAVRCIVKDPLALYASEWLVEEMGLRPVVIVRHPVRVAKSMLRLGWTNMNLHPLLSQPDLVARFYPDGIESARNDARRMHDGPVELRVCLQVKHWMHALARLRAAHPDWIWLDYDHLLTVDAEEFLELFRRLGLEPTDASREALEGDGRRDPQLTHQKTLARIPAKPLFAAECGVDRWQHLHAEHFEAVIEALGSFYDR